MPDKYISASLWFQMMENSTDYNRKIVVSNVARQMKSESHFGKN